MLHSSVSEYKRWIYVALGIMIATAWFSVGFYHPDEHFQILEFASYKLGLSPSTDLPWEFAAKCRPGLQPLLVFAMGRLMMVAGRYDPFLLAFLLRAFTGLLTWWVTLRFVNTFISELNERSSKRIFVLTAFLLWFVPYFGVRFTAETLAGDFFVLGVTLLYPVSTKERRTIPSLLLAGCYLGMAIYLRLQTGFAIAGVGLGLLWLRRWPVIFWLAILSGGLIAIGLGLLADHWLYNEWVFSPYNYFDVNIIKNVAAKFGVEPWWYYFLLFFNLAIPPLSLILMTLFLSGVFYRWKHLLSLACIIFFVGHFAVGHKEMRFLLPMTLPFIYMVVAGWERVVAPHWHRGAIRILVNILIGLNASVLIFKMFTPAEEVIKYYRFIYAYSQKQPTTIIGLGKSPFMMDPVLVNFYKPEHIKVAVVSDSISLKNVLSKDSCCIYLSHSLIPPSELHQYKTDVIYTQYPDWLLKFNFNHWQERSYLWAIFRVSNP